MEIERKGYSIPEAAKIIGVSAGTLRKAVNAWHVSTPADIQEDHHSQVGR